MSEQPWIPQPIGPPSWDEVIDYLGTNAPRDEAVSLGAWKAEKAAQRSVCDVPTDDVVWPDDLREALCRRVAHNIAMRGIPLAVQESASETGGAIRVGGTDPEVRRLEAIYRKRKLA